MLRLAVTTRKETFTRLCDPLADRGIEVVHLRARERTLRVTGTPDLPAVDAGLVYPTRPMEGGAIDAHLRVPWVNDREAVLTSRNKAGVLAALSAAGLPVPETVLISNPVDEAAVVDAVSDLSFPVVVKPNSTTRGVGVTKAADEDSLFGIVDYLNLVHDYRATGDRSFLVQEYLPNARDYRAMVVGGTCYGGVERRLPGDARDAGRWKHNVHRGAEAIAVDLPDDFRRLAERTAETLGIDYLGVDLLATDDRVVVGETNARPTVDDETKYDRGFFDALAALVTETAAGGE